MTALDLTRTLRQEFERGDRTQAAIYTRDPECIGIIRQAMRELPGCQADFRSDGLRGAAGDVVDRGSPRLLIVDISDEADPVDRIRELCGMCEPSTHVVVVGVENDIRLYRALLDAGASEYFFKPLVSAVVTRSLRKMLLGDATNAGTARVGQTIYVVGVRGGSGATTIAVTLGAMLSASPPRPVLLLDLDLQRGDAALTLETTPNPALREAFLHADRIDDLLLERGLIHVTKQLDLLASLEPVHSATAVNEDAVSALLDRVARRYRYIIAEIPAHAAGALERVLHMPSTLVLVSDARLASARDVARWRTWFAESASERNCLHVLNMAGAPGTLPVAEFANVAGAQPNVIIPYSADIATQALVGSASAPAGALAKAIHPLASTFGLESVQARRPLLKRMFG
jgi:pilus assembly protein CpaE